MLRKAIITFVGVYLFAAAMTFNFAEPINCAAYDDLSVCVTDNLARSALAAVLWPAFWLQEVTK